MGAVAQHYGSAGIVERVLAAIPGSDRPEFELKATDLFRFDQLHGRELVATKEHAARLSPGTSDHVLDVGSGIGGPARYMAHTFGCHVTGVDVTPQFVAAASRLTEACGLSELVQFLEADAEKLPLEDAAFDAATCFYVGMNLSDKPAVIREVHRVLKPGGASFGPKSSSLEISPPFTRCHGLATRARVSLSAPMTWKVTSTLPASPSRSSMRPRRSSSTPGKELLPGKNQPRSSGMPTKSSWDPISQKDEPCSSDA